MSQVDRLGAVHAPSTPGSVQAAPPPPPPSVQAPAPPAAPVSLPYAGAAALPPPVPAMEAGSAQRRRALRMIRSGAVLFVIGIVITAVTYQLAAGTGGFYFVMYGPIIVGVWNTIRGIILLVRSAHPGRDVSLASPPAPR